MFGVDHAIPGAVDRSVVLIEWRGRDPRVSPAIGDMLIDRKHAKGIRTLVILAALDCSVGFCPIAGEHRTANERDLAGLAGLLRPRDRGWSLEQWRELCEREGFEPALAEEDPPGAWAPDGRLIWSAGYADDEVMA